VTVGSPAGREALAAHMVVDHKDPSDPYHMAETEVKVLPSAANMRSRGVRCACAAEMHCSTGSGIHVHLKRSSKRSRGSPLYPGGGGPMGGPRLS
jgi:hypothetical protein